jgi:hypothetical protein
MTGAPIYTSADEQTAESTSPVTIADPTRLVAGGAERHIMFAR